MAAAGGSVEQLSRTLGLREEKSREEVPLSFGALLELVGWHGVVLYLITILQSEMLACTVRALACLARLNNVDPHVKIWIFHLYSKSTAE